MNGVNLKDKTNCDGKMEWEQTGDETPDLI